MSHRQDACYFIVSLFLFDSCHFIVFVCVWPLFSSFFLPSFFLSFLPAVSFFLFFLLSYLFPPFILTPLPPSVLPLFSPFPPFPPLPPPGLGVQQFFHLITLSFLLFFAPSYAQSFSPTIIVLISTY